MRCLLVCVVAVGTAGVAAAQDLSFDPAATQTCLDEADWTEGPPYDCVGEAANACMSTTDGSTTVGMGFCLDAEWQWWDARLNRVYADLMAQDKAADDAMAEAGTTVPSLADNLRAMQRAWIPFRDAACDYEMAQWGGGTGQGPALVGCLMMETGRQTLSMEARLGG
ncbi:MAG: lysozyme inhibitor LprI family protein [Gemmobacter sp.]